MLDQSFSADNFRKILDMENRKGLYLEGRFFPNLEQITERIKNSNAEIREKKKDRVKNEAKLKELYEAREELKKTKEELLTNELQKVRDKVVARSFKIELKKIDIPSDKPIYTLRKTPEHFFAIKQLQQNVSRLYDVKQANRSAIVNQVKVLLGDQLPKYVLRTDIEDFYEKIPHEPILNRINKDNLLTPFSKKLLAQILYQYKKESGTDRGIPRGIGVSAYIAELYMRGIDDAIKNLRDVTFYARYVDDIIIIFTPSTHDYAKDYMTEVSETVEHEKLTLNASKTEPFDLRKGSKNCQLEYLGYKISFGAKETKTRLTSKRIHKYEERMDLTFTAYVNLSKVNENKARKILVRRIRFLTGNTRLMNNKKNILVGIYYSNNELTEQDDLILLDKYLREKIDSLNSSPLLQERLKKYNFQEGYNKKRFSPYKIRELSEIMEIWGKRFP